MSDAYGCRARGGYPGPNLPGVPKSEAPGRSPAGPRGVPKSEIADASQFRSPGHDRLHAAFSMFESSARVVWNEPSGAPGVPKSDVFQRLDRGGVPKSEPPTIFRSQLYLEESYIND